MPEYTPEFEESPEIDDIEELETAPEEMDEESARYHVSAVQQNCAGHIFR